MARVIEASYYPAVYQFVVQAAPYIFTIPSRASWSRDVWVLPGLHYTGMWRVKEDMVCPLLFATLLHLTPKSSEVL